MRTISYREYKNRQGIEPVLDIRHQEDINKAIGDAEHVHVTFKKGEVRIRPINDIASYDAHAKFNEMKVDADGVYANVLSVVDMVREKRFTSLDIEADADFLESRECLLLCLQLRRLGYDIETSEQGLLALRDGAVSSNVTQIDLSANFHEVTPAVLNTDTPLSSFTMCTGGVDVYAMAKEGFVNESVLEWRPPEKRDFSKTVSKKTGETTVRFNDKTDTGALCAALNCPDVKVLFNEDIYTVDEAMVAEYVGQVNHMSGALQCDDFSCLKNANDRAKAIASLDTTIDMFFNVLRLLKAVNAPTLLMENVRNFATSMEAKLFTKGLQRLGYTVNMAVMNAKHYQGMTNRERAFVFASKLDAPFAFPAPVENTKHADSDVVAKHLDEMRDLTHTKTVQAGIEQGRIRYISEGDALAPTIVRSQAKQTKDAVYIKRGDRYYLPSNTITKALMGIGEDFDMSPFSNEIGSEIVGQSIEVPMHQMIGAQIKRHIEAALNAIVPVRKTPTQLSLFA